MSTIQSSDIESFVRNMLAEASAKFPDAHFAFFAITADQTGDHDMLLASNMKRDLLKGMLVEYLNEDGSSEVQNDTSRAH